ncbi:AI-2E family transporter [Rhodococcus sp. NPDC003322]
MADREHQHDAGVGLPHTPAESEPIRVAEARAAGLGSREHPRGVPGPPFNRRSPFLVGMAAAAGVVVVLAGVEVIISTRQMLLLIALAVFLAIGLEPAVSWLVRRGFPRWAAVTTVFVVALGLVAGFLALAIPPLINQGGALVQSAPDHLHDLERRYPVIDRLSSRLHIQDQLEHALDQSGFGLVGGLVGAGRVVFGAVSGSVIVTVLTAYLLADFPRVRASLYRLVPSARRPRTILIGDEVLAKVGAYVLGNLLISLITAAATFVWLVAFGVPYALLLAVLVGVLDLIPIVGSTLAGIVVALVALSVSLSVAIATVVFFLVLRLLEDYLLVPKIIGRSVRVPPLVTVVAVLVGGALLGMLGALLAIPVAAAVLLIVQETVLPRLDSE